MKLYCKQNGFVSLIIDDLNYLNTLMSSYIPVEKVFSLTIGKEYECEQIAGNKLDFLVIDDNGDIVEIPRKLFTGNKERVNFSYDIKNEYKAAVKVCEDDKKDTERMMNERKNKTFINKIKLYFLKRKN